MVSFREIPRTATFSWSPDPTSQTLVTGTKAGAVDEGFSDDTQLELWDLQLDDVRGNEIGPIAGISSDSRFNDIAWTLEPGLSTKSLIAGALENGSLDLWDAQQLRDTNPDAFISRTTKHSGAIKALQFNPFRAELLATVGVKGELFISDVNNVGNPFRKGNAVARADDFECLDWNKKTSHIMVTGSSGGIITVWDIKNRKESLTLNNLGRRPVSAVAWDPVKTTRMITAVPSDTDPHILVWDLRNANAPERILKGHDGGVLSLSWCPQDSNLLLSCGKDNRTICWNPQSGESLGEFPIVTNWTFQTRWNPRNPSFVATSSFDGKIAVNKVQHVLTEKEPQLDSQSQTIDDEDFFSKAQSPSATARFSLATPPKWLQRPSGAHFAFGGKIVSFKSPAGDIQRRSVIRISSYAIDDGISASAKEFEASIERKDFRRICDSKLAAAKNDLDRYDWQIIKLLTADDLREQLSAYLGFDNASGKNIDGVIDNTKTKLRDDLSENRSNQAHPPAQNNRLSAFFESGGENEFFLSELAATKGAKTNNPFQIYSGTESHLDRQITTALLLGDFDRALDTCINEDRISDAFMIAICGGQRCIEKAQKAYFKQRDSAPNYLRILASLVGKNLWDLVHNANLGNWREILATICTYSSQSEFPDLCETLGDRLEEHSEDEGQDETRKSASLCYLMGSKLDKFVAIWLAELSRQEYTSLTRSSTASGFSLHASLLQEFIEKVTVFREVMHFSDPDQNSSSGWRLAPLYDKYLEYADLTAAHGQLQVAERYLELLPGQYAAADVAKARVRNALIKPIAQPASGQQGSNQRSAQPASVAAPNKREATSGSSIVSNTANQYFATAQAANPYAPATSRQQGVQAYGIPEIQQQQPPPPPQPGMAYTLQSSAPAPPEPTLASPLAKGSHSNKHANVGNWNDMPDSFFKPPTTSRRGTPVGAANNSYQHHQNPVSAAQVAGPPPPRATSALGPPPKAGGVPNRMDSTFQSSPIERPPSAANPYTPAANSLPVDVQAKISRGPSPYNLPPSAPPPSNRYAPADQNVSSHAENPSTNPGVRQPAPPPNPYAPKPASIVGSQLPAHQRGQLPSAPPTSKPSDTGRDSTKSITDPPGAIDTAKNAARNNYRTSPVIILSVTCPNIKPAPGDRSHISSSAAPIYEILNKDMQRVKSRAPASFKAQVDNTEKRINLLFDHLNNDDLLQPDTVASMVELARAMQAREYETAQSIHVEIMTNKNDQCGNWMVRHHSQSPFQEQALIRITPGGGQTTYSDEPSYTMTNLALSIDLWQMVRLK